MEPVIELGYTNILVTPKSKGSKQLRNAVYTFGSQFHSFPGKGMEKKKDITMKNIFNISNGSIADSLIKFKKNEKSNKNGEPSRLLANRNINFKNKEVPLIEVVVRDMIEEKAKEIDSGGIKFFKGKQYVYIDYREDYENLVEDMSKKLITIFNGSGGVKTKTVTLGGVTSSFKLPEQKPVYKYTSSKLVVRLRVFTIKGGVIPTEIQEAGTTVILNAILHGSRVEFNTEDDIKKHTPTMNGLENVFGPYKNRLNDWIHTYFEQQRSILDINKFKGSSWDEFEYGNDSFTKFFEKEIVNATRSEKGQKGRKITVKKYTEWNPSDIWAAYDLPNLKKEIKDNLYGKDRDTETYPIVKLNALLSKYFSEDKLIGLSLKKIGKDKEAHVAFYNNGVKDIQLKVIDEYEINDLIFDINNIVEPNVATTYVKYGSDAKFKVSLTRTSGGTLSINTSIKGASAQAGQAVIEMVTKLLKDKLSPQKMFFIKDKGDNVYPQNYKSWEDLDSKHFEDYVKMYDSLKSHFKNPPKDFNKFLDGALKETYKKDGALKTGFSRNAVIKLIQIRFFYDIFRMKNNDIKEFWQDILYLGMKVNRGDRFEFGPFGKISDV